MTTRQQVWTTIAIFIALIAGYNWQSWMTLGGAS